MFLIKSMGNPWAICRAAVFVEQSKTTENVELPFSAHESGLCFYYELRIKMLMLYCWHACKQINNWAQRIYKTVVIKYYKIQWYYFRRFFFYVIHITLLNLLSVIVLITKTVLENCIDIKYKSVYARDRNDAMNITHTKSIQYVQYK